MRWAIFLLLVLAACQQGPESVDAQNYRIQQPASVPDGITGCDDTDEGKVLGKRGTAVDWRGEKTDYCQDDRTILEYFCAGNQVVSDSEDCGYGMLCRDGACVEAPKMKMACSPGDYKCREDILQKCSPLGEWEDIQKCEYGCGNSQCLTNDCNVPGETRCSGKYLQSCRKVDLKWETIRPCDKGCEDGKCVQ